MQPKVASGSSSAGSRVLVAMVPAKDRQSDDSSGTTQGGLSNETVSLVSWQTILLVYAAGQIRDKGTDGQDLTGQDTAGAAVLYLLRRSKK
jgi:hypothetical protein